MAEKFSALDFTTFQEEVNNSNYDGWSFIFMTLVIGKPLDHDKEVHVAKDHH